MATCGAILPLLAVVSLVHLSVCQTGGSVTYHIPEEQPVGEVIGNIITDAHLDSRYPADAVRELRFRFLQEPSITIAIGHDTGILTTNGVIDRELIPECRMQEQCQVTLDVAVQPRQYFQIIKLIIHIVDINDNAPEFPQDVYEHSMKESTSLESTFVIPSAIDIDSPSLGVQSYKLRPEVATEQLFTLQVTNNPDGSQGVKLKLVTVLDRELNDRYSMVLEAIDGGTPPKSGTLEIIINVQDSNDNDPVFKNASYEVTIPENIPVQDTILRVEARDRDIGDNGLIQYRFSPQTSAAFGDIFGIDRETGEIYVIGVIDYESAKLYNLMVTAQDMGPDSQPTDTNVVIHVQDLNDNKPTIVVNTLSASDTNTAEISEDADIGTFVAHVTVTDDDAGNNGQFDCNLNDNAFKLQRTEFGSEYQIKTTILMDRERMEKYSLALRCQDNGEPALMATHHIQVNVIDINDHDPVFSQASYTAYIIENIYLGAIVLQVNATDADAGDNARITYTLSDNVADVFHINPDTGVISAQAQIDREEVALYRFYVLAEDGGTPRRSASVTVIVTVEDVNDERPVFTDEHFLFTVSENEEPGTLVGTVSAVDRDGPDNNEFYFSFLHGSYSTNAFMIDPKSGKILTRQRLDRESRSTYNMVIAVKDTNAPNKFSSTASVTIYVNDVNDNSPIFDYPTPMNNTIYMSNKVPIGYNITRVRSHDPDIGPNGYVTYDIQSGNAEGIFAIDPDSGILSTDMQLTNLEYKLSRLQILAKDNGKDKVRTQFADLTIVVNKSIPYLPPGAAHGGILSNQNLLIVISVACGCAIVVVILIVAIICIRRQDKLNRSHRYNCRMEAIGRLTAKETIGHQDMVCLDPEKASLKDKVLTLEKERPASPIIQDSFYPDSKREIPSPLPSRKMAPDMHGTLLREMDQLSIHSNEGSNTDSGRGPSEEGDNKHGPLGAQRPLSPTSSTQRSTHSSMGPYATPTYGYYPHLKAHSAAHSYSSHPPQKLRSFAPEEGGSGAKSPTEGVPPKPDTHAAYVRPARVLPAHGNGGYASRAELRQNYNIHNGPHGNGMIPNSEDHNSNIQTSTLGRAVTSQDRVGKGLVV